MLRYCGNILLKTNYIMAAVWLATVFTTTPVCGNTNATLRTNSFQLSAAEKKAITGLQCAGLQAEKWICSLDSGDRRGYYFDTPRSSHASSYFDQRDPNPRKADPLKIGLLAVEEFNLLAPLRVYYERTEKYIKKLSIKLKLKGEVTVSEPQTQIARHQPEVARLAKRTRSARPSDSAGMLSLFKPQTIRWNLGMDPDDLSISFDLEINPHLSFDGEFGDENKVGLYFKFLF